VKAGPLAALTAAAVGAAIVAFSIWSGAKAYRLWQFPRTPVPPDLEARALAEIPGLEEITLRTSDGLSLRGWFLPGTLRAAVILVHGGGGNRLQMLPETRVLSRHGYGILAYDSRASGESDGDGVTWGDGEQRDLTAALDYVSTRSEIDPARIAVLGFSIGGSTVAMTASRDPRPRAVILYATWPSLADEMRFKLGRYNPVGWAPELAMRLDGVAADNVRPIDAIGAIHPRPLLMITGELDPDTPVPIMRRLFDAAGEPKELWVVPRANHGGYAEASPAEYESRVTAFLDRALLGQTPKP
jgi:dipeptidyl aminopeptidase/acylaminoacyl peptidase